MGNLFGPPGLRAKQVKCTNSTISGLKKHSPERAKKESPATAELSEFKPKVNDQPFISEGIITIGGNDQVEKNCRFGIRHCRFSVNVSIEYLKFNYFQLNDS
jgi:hypothetical protein